MKKFAQFFGIVLVVLVLAYWLLVDMLLEQVIEREGTKALKAKVDVEEVDFHLFGGPSVEVHGITAANPRAPMRNLAEIGTASLEVTLEQLLAQHIIAEQMIISGLRLNQPRKSSGAVPGLTPEPQTEEAGGGLPALSLPDPEELIEAEKERLENELSAIEDELRTIEKRWEQRIEELPDEATVQEYRERFKKLKGGNILSGLSELDTLRKDLKQEIGAIDSLDEELNADLATVKQKVRTATQLPAQATQRLIEQSGLDVSSFDRLAQSLLGDKYYSLVQQMLAMAGSGEEAQPEQPAAASDWLLTVREALIDGEVPLGKNSLPFEGIARNISSQLDKAEQAMTFELFGGNAGSANLSASGTLDHRGEGPQDSIRFDLDQLPLDGWVLSDRPELAIVLREALASIAGRLSVNGDQIDGGISNRFAGTVFDVDSPDAGELLQALASALSGVQQFNVDVGIDGRLSAPAIAIRSSLDQVLSQALGTQLRQQAQKLEGQMKQKLNAELGPEIQNIQSLGSQLDALDGVLGERKDALRSIL